MVKQGCGAAEAKRGRDARPAEGMPGVPPVPPERGAAAGAGPGGMAADTDREHPWVSAGSSRSQCRLIPEPVRDPGMLPPGARRTFLPPPAAFPSVELFSRSSFRLPPAAAAPVS